MKQKTKNAAFWLKGFVWLLVVMLLFTIVSRAADALTVAKVSVVNPSARKLQYSVIAEGRIEKNREISVLTCPDLLVKSIQVSEGQRVNKGAVLAKLDKDSLEEKIDETEDEIKAMELENAATEANQKQEQKKQQQEFARAKSDYTEVKKENEKALLRAKKELEKAKDALKKQKKKGEDKNSVAELQALVEEKKGIWGNKGNWKSRRKSGKKGS